jgi:MFS family permease
MYTSVRNRPSVEAAEPGRTARGRIGRNVVLLGLVSLFTDLSQEMVVAVLPLYLTAELGLSALQFGIVDGLYGGATALVRLLGGYAADLRSRYKQVAAVGYGASAGAKLGLFLALGAWLPTTIALVVDRLGKGLRTAPRDALISLSSDASVLGRAFGVHRALDTVGALLGPLAAFLVLATAPGSYDAIFLLSFCVALVGLGILLLFVQNRRPGERGDAGPRVSLRSAIGLLADARFRTVVLVGGGLGALTISDAFVYLVLQQEAEFGAKWFPLLFLGTAGAYLALAVPLGRLADTVGRANVFLGGHVVLIVLYVALAQVGGTGPAIVACLLLLGVYYAATDGVLMALASSVLPESLRSSGLALVTTSTALARFGSSLAFGACWTAWGPRAAIVGFAIALAAALPVAAAALHRQVAVP